MFPSASASVFLLWLCFHVVGGIAVPALPAPGAALLSTSPPATESPDTRSEDGDAACPAPGYSACGGGLPDDFCCEAGSLCLVLAANTTGLCCPPGGGCGSIFPITCDLQAQNVTAYPESPILTTDLAGELPRCGRDAAGVATCCPFGYACRDGSICVLDAERATTSPSSAPAPTPASTSTSRLPASAASVASAATAAAGTPSASPATLPLGGAGDPSAGAGAPRAAGVIAGAAAAGLVSLVGLAVLVWKNQRGLARLLRRSEWRPAPGSPAASSYSLGPVGASKDGAGPAPSPGSPVELPATPLSFSFWARRSVRASRQQQPVPGTARDSSEGV